MNPSNDHEKGFKGDFIPDEDSHSKGDFIADVQERTPLEKGARVGAQLGLGLLEGTASGIVYNLAVAPLSNQEAQTVNYRQNLFEDIERLQEQKSAGVWDKQDQSLLDNLIDQVKNPSKSKEFVKTAPDLSIRGLAEAVTGVDLHPEGIMEKAANWIGFIKDPRKIREVAKLGLNSKELMKAIAPMPTEIFRGVGAGVALQMAEDGKFGPIGTLGAAIAGDLIGHGPKVALNIAKNPKGAIAETVNFLTMNNTKRLSAQQLVEDFSKSNINVDVGTLTGSPLIQMMQARLTQSGLTGTALENFRKELSGQIVKEYENILGDIGEITFENNFQASEAIKNALKTEEVRLNALPQEGIKEQQTNARSLQGRVNVEERPDYQNELLNRISQRETVNDYVGGETLKTAAEDIRQPIKEEFNGRWEQLNRNISQIESAPQAQLVSELDRFVSEHRGSLLLGESAPEARVLRAAEELLNNLRTADGSYIGVNLDQLIKTRRTLGDVANWEMAGSDFESAYKKLVGDLNSAIERTLMEFPELRNEYLTLNADYSAYKDLFENKNLQKLYNPSNNNYNTIYREFSRNPDKLRALEDIFYSTPRGEQLINQIKRDYAQNILESPNLTARDIRNLQQVLGPEFDGDILRFVNQRQEALEHPLPRASLGQPLQVSPTFSPSAGGQSLQGRASTASTPGSKAATRKRLSKKLAGKDSNEIMSQMDTVEGIKELRRALETTPEGKELFKQLTRYKLAELIDKKMTDGVTDQIKLGKFSKLLESKQSKDIVRELLPKPALERLLLLQKNSGKLAESASKFFNASQSGTTLVDVGLIGAAATGIMLGNPYMAVPALLKIGGSYTMANLFSDPVFLKELEKAILTNNPKKFESILKNMQPRVQAAILESQHINEEQKQ